MPWPIKATQIDGGSEFMDDFEKPASSPPPHLLAQSPEPEPGNGSMPRKISPTVSGPEMINRELEVPNVYNLSLERHSKFSLRFDVSHRIEDVSHFLEQIGQVQKYIGVLRGLRRLRSF